MSEQPNIFAFIALLGWIPLVILLFAYLPPRRAVLYGYFVAWLFLPMAHIRVHGLTDYNKISAAGFGVLLSALIFDGETVFAFRAKIWDLPMLIWCICPFFSSLDNGLGWYDGIVSSVYQTTSWGLPYLVGRIYFNSLGALRELSVALVVGGLVYVPFCWFEIRFSPQLHYRLYGFYAQEFVQSIRGGGYRPMVFMQHGLAVGMWMSVTTLTAYWLYLSGLQRRVLGLPMGTAFIILMVTSYFCHSLGSTILMFIGLAILTLTYWTQWSVWILILALAPCGYMVTRTLQLWNGDTMIRLITRINHDRANSATVRLRSEDLIITRSLQKPIFGWGGWDRFRQGAFASATPDALWIIAFGHNGMVGLTAMTLMQLLPVLLLASKIPVRLWIHPGAAPAAALAVLLALYLSDNLANAMVNPIYFLGAGGICGLGVSLNRQEISYVGSTAGPSATSAMSGYSIAAN